MTVFRQILVHEEPGALVTLLPRADVPGPVMVDGRTLLEPGAPIVWFTFPGAWHDIGRFHTADGRFTGLYANILTPVTIRSDRWETTDLYLDVVLEPGRAPRLLDQQELEAALEAGDVSPSLAEAARTEGRRLMEAATAGRWPPPVVEAWPLERARAAVVG